MNHWCDWNKLRTQLLPKRRIGDQTCPIGNEQERNWQSAYLGFTRNSFLVARNLGQKRIGVLPGRNSAKTIQEHQVCFQAVEPMDPIFDHVAVESGKSRARLSVQVVKKEAKLVG
jgi:hypothetical protein